MFEKLAIFRDYWRHETARQDEHRLFYRISTHDGDSQPVEALLTVKGAAEKTNVCEESIRRAYVANQLAVVRFGSRAIRIHPRDLTDWMARGMKTKGEAGPVFARAAA